MAEYFDLGNLIRKYATESYFTCYKVITFKVYVGFLTLLTFTMVLIEFAQSHLVTKWANDWN